MKAMSVVFDFYLIGALSIIFGILVSNFRNISFVGQNIFAFAFCYDYNLINSQISQRMRYTFARRDNSIDEWVSYLEEEFNRSGDDVNSESNEKDVLPPIQPYRTFKTPVKSCTSVIDFLDQIDNAPPNDLTVVLYFAHYCRTCHRAIVPFKQLANDSTPGINFVRFETSPLSPRQFHSLGIDRVPFLQIYRNGICVVSFSAIQRTSLTSSKIVLRPRLLESIDVCQRRSMSDWLAFRDKYDREIEANKAGRASIRQNLNARQNNGRGLAVDDGGSYDREEKLYRSVQTITSESELLDLIHESNYFDNGHNTSNDHKDENRFVVIMFHSHFDQSCLRAQHKFRKIANERQHQSRLESRDGCQSSYIMARVEASILPEKTLQKLGIQRFPHIQIYSSSNRSNKTEGGTLSKECIASFSIPQSFLFAKIVRASLDAIDKRTSEQWTEFYNQHHDLIKSQQLALEGITRERKQR